METLTLELTDMAHGGDALGRDENGRVIFVPFTIPGEEVRVEIVEDKERFAHARLLEVLQPSPQRAEPRCPHFGVCGGCHWQHIDYEAQLEYKREIVRDQLQRIGRMEGVDVRPTPPNPQPWEYSTDVSFSPAPQGELGFWSPFLGQVMPIEVCYIIRPRLLELFQDIDLSLPGLRRMTLRLGDDGALLVALEVDGVEPPQLAADFPVSAAMVLPDGTAANLVGDNHVVKAVKGRDFRVSAGSFFYPSPEAAAQLVDAVLSFADLDGSQTVLEAFCGVGTVTAFLAQQAADVFGIEAAPDAVADAAFNLDDTDNVALYEGVVAEVLPGLSVQPDVMVVDPPAEGLSREVVAQIAELGPQRLIYVSADVATLARDGRQLNERGFRPVAVQPIDMMPQTFHVYTVGLWEKEQ
ncbi:MAG: class I SAM-dependent RNA methyltransferase [Chloroflexota bacterium]